MEKNPPLTGSAGDRIRLQGTDRRDLVDQVMDLRAAVASLRQERDSAIKSGRSWEIKARRFEGELLARGL